MLHRSLDVVFQALSDATRRAMIEQLGSGPASVSELGSPFSMSLSAIGQHIQLLEEAGLVRTEKTGRTRTVQLAPGGLTGAERWLESHK